jgi:hypothetical protein
LKNLLDHRKRLATTRALLAADQHMLKDIGVSRFEIALADCGLQTVICRNQPGHAQGCVTRHDRHHVEKREDGIAWAGGAVRATASSQRSHALREHSEAS